MQEPMSRLKDADIGHLSLMFMNTILSEVELPFAFSMINNIDTNHRLELASETNATLLSLKVNLAQTHRTMNLRRKVYGKQRLPSSITTVCTRVQNSE